MRHGNAEGPGLPRSALEESAHAQHDHSCRDLDFVSAGCVGACGGCRRRLSGQTRSSRHRQCAGVRTRHRCASAVRAALQVVESTHCGRFPARRCGRNQRGHRGARSLRWLHVVDAHVAAFHRDQSLQRSQVRPGPGLRFRCPYRNGAVRSQREPADPGEVSLGIDSAFERDTASLWLGGNGRRRTPVHGLLSPHGGHADAACALQRYRAGAGGCGRERDSHHLRSRACGAPDGAGRPSTERSA